MVCMSDQKWLAACGAMELDLTMHLGDEGTGRVDVRYATPFRFRPDRLRDTVGREHDRRTVRDLIEFLYKDRSLSGKTGDDPRVVHDLMPNENRRAKPVEALFDGFNRASHPSATSAGAGQYNRKAS